MAKGSVEGVVAWAVNLPDKFREEARVTWWIASCQELVAWHYRYVLTGFTCKEQEEGWRLVVHVRGNKGNARPGPLVAFFYADTFWDCWRLFAHQLHRKEIQWRTDKYAQT